MHERWFDAQRFTVARRVELLIDLCRAVTHAQAVLIGNRDLQPSSVVVTAAGVLKPLDFGVAKLIASDVAELAELIREVLP